MSNALSWLSRENQRFLVRGLKARFISHRIEFRLIREHVQSTDTVCDVGANKGSFLFWLSRWCRNGRVIAFEPQPPFAAMLGRISDTLGLANIVLEQKAVFSRSGQADLFVPQGHSPGASLVGKSAGAGVVDTISVPLVRLDDYFTPDQTITFMKVDVEGAELEVFRGAERILREQSPLLLFECEGRHLGGTATMDDVFAYLIGLGYAGQFIADQRLLPLSIFDAAIHQKQDGPWFWKAKTYYNNFVFRKMPQAPLRSTKDATDR